MSANRPSEDAVAFILGMLAQAHQSDSILVLQLDAESRGAIRVMG